MIFYSTAKNKEVASCVYKSIKGEEVKMQLFKQQGQSLLARIACLVIGSSLLAFGLYSPANAELQWQLAPSRHQPVQYQIQYQKENTGRVLFGAERLAAALKKAGLSVKLTALEATKKTPKIATASKVIYIGVDTLSSLKTLMTAAQDQLLADSIAEGFTIHSLENGSVLISGTDLSGALYGALELTDRISQLSLVANKSSSARLDSLLSHLQVKDSPQMKLRGACIGMQKPYLLPGRGTYEYPYTKELFPWFYDKQLWVKYLDMLVDNRMNTLYLWSGHPFASLVRLKDYPEAVEVDSATFRANQEMFHFLTTEANKRGIWVIQAFYNIIISKPFAEQHHLKTQDRNRPIIPLIADYTRKSIAAFVEQYPNVGLLTTLGEAMEGVGPDDTEWFTKTIIPGVKDGLKALGETRQPPLILRAHDADAPAVMKAAKEVYSNLYTMATYNGEALTTYTPRGSWAALHRQLSSVAPVHVENVHILANLEPFRYGSDDFIQKSVQAMHHIYGANGLHLYPEASYWDWPYSADKVDGRLLQINRDWIWYAEWARYAWNADRDRAAEKSYWAARIAKSYGADQKTGSAIREAYEAAGEIAPKLLRRYGITDGNRQTLSLGMLMSQLIHPEKYGLFSLLYESEAPEGEMITQYAEKEWLGEQHTGETPMQIAVEVMKHADSAVEAIKSAEPGIQTNKQEFERLKNDIISYQHLATFYSKKVQAALKVLRYGYSHDVQDLVAAAPLLKESLVAFEQLARTAGAGYLYANSLQTGARKIPMTGKDGQYKTWNDLLPVYKEELINFEKHIAALKAHGANTGAEDQDAAQLLPASVRFISPAAGTGEAPLEELGSYQLAPAKRGYYSLQSKGQPFTDTTVLLDAVAKVFKRLEGIQVDRKRQQAAGTKLSFYTEEPVQLYVGFFTKKDKAYLKEPELETDASANDYGQAETQVANAGLLPGYPAINIHSYHFGKGRHSLQLGKGVCLILGFAKDAKGKTFAPFDAGIGNSDNRPDLDWLFR